MTVASQGAMRVGVAALVAVLLQLSTFGQIRLLGSSADLVPLLVAAVGLYGGSVAGAAAGFGTGLALDLALGTTLGASSLVLAPVGYGVGRYREVRRPAHDLTAMPVGAAATAGYLVGLGLVNLMLEIGAPVSQIVLRDTLVTVGLNALLALPVFTLLRRWLRPVLGADPLERRRRRPAASGPLGLRGLGA